MTDADLCRQNGWKVGDVLRSEFGLLVRITAIGEKFCLVSECRDGNYGDEHYGALHNGWRKLEPDPPPPSCSIEHQVAELTKQLAEANRLRDADRAEAGVWIDKVRSKLIDTQAALAATRRERDENFNCAESWRQRYDTANAEHVELKRQLDHAIYSRDIAQELLSEARRVCDELRAEIDELLNRADSATDRGDAVITAHAETVVQLSGRIEKLEAEVAEKAKQIEAAFGEGWRALADFIYEAGRVGSGNLSASWQASNARKAAGGGE